MEMLVAIRLSTNMADHGAGCDNAVDTGRTMSLASSPSKISPSSSRERLSDIRERESLAGTLTFGAEGKAPNTSFSENSNLVNQDESADFEMLVDSDKNPGDDSIPDVKIDQSLDLSNGDVNLDELLADNLNNDSSPMSDLAERKTMMSSAYGVTQPRRHLGSSLSPPRTSTKKPGANLSSSSRAASVDQYLSGNRRKAASSDVSRFLIEKEVLESQLHKLQVENSTLTTENKLLKEKHNRAQVRIVQLENQVKGVKHEAMTLCSEYQDGPQRFQLKINDLQAQLESLNAQNSSLQTLLDSTRSLSTQTSPNSKLSNYSRIIDSFKVENMALKDELRQVRRLLTEGNHALGIEVDRRQEVSAQVVRLTELKAILQQQLEQSGGGSVAERQVRSLERRLKITEERLHQERSDRANKLSNMEDKLINENAHLQVAKKELKRQLTRERDKHKTINQKHKDLRDENERLRILLAETNFVTENQELLKLRHSHQKHAPNNIDHIYEELRKDVGLGPGQEPEMIWLLWQRNASLRGKLRQWEIDLEELNVKVNGGQVTGHSLKLVRDERAMLEDRIDRYKDTLEDVTKEKEELDTIFRGRITELTTALHGATADNQNLKDTNDAITAENESLRCSLLNCGEISTETKQNEPVSTVQAQLEALRSRLLAVETESLQKSRTERHLESELSSVRAQLTAKDAALEEALTELQRTHAGHLDGGDLIEVKQQQIEKLSAEKTSLEAGHSLRDSEIQRLSARYEECVRDAEYSKQQLADAKRHAERLEQQLTDEKSKRDMLNHGHSDLISSLRLQLEMANSKLDMEQRNLLNLKETLQQEEEKVFNLNEMIKTQLLELETLRCHLSENRNTIDQHKKDKQTLYQDVQELCRKLMEKDDTMVRMQEKANDAVDHLQKDFNSEKAWMTKEREVLELDLAKTKEEVCDLTEKVKRKEVQLEAFTRTNQDLELERHARADAENHVTKLEVEIAEARQTLSTLQLDSTRKDDLSKYTKESLDRAQSQVDQMSQKLKIQREQYTTETNELRQSLTIETHKLQSENSKLQEKLNKVLSDLHAKEVTLASYSEAKKSLYENLHSLEKTVDSLKSQLHEEITARKLAEQKNEAYKTQLDDLRSKRGSQDEQYTELQALLTKTETKLNLEREKYRHLKQEFTDERSTSSNVEAHAQALHTQITELQVEVASLKSQLESQKQNLTGKNKRLTLDMKQQMENFDKERSKFVAQVDKLSSDLESVREQVATKNCEQLKLQEDILTLEEKVHEAVSKKKHVMDLLNIEEQHREKLELRNQELELKLRLHSDASNSVSTKFDDTKAEVSKMMSEMQKKMKDQLEQSKVGDKELAARHHKQVEEWKKKVASVESALSQEQAMHLITKTQLLSLDEDNQRLRQQLQATRKRNNPASEEKSKSRMEEINEIIARSQMRTQQMLATGSYNMDESIRSSTGRDLLSPIPFIPPHLNISGHSDNRSVISDDLNRDHTRNFASIASTEVCDSIEVEKSSG